MDNLLEHKINSADMRLVVRYQPWLIPISIRQEFRYNLERDAEGRQVWLPGAVLGAEIPGGSGQTITLSDRPIFPQN
jgi:hypothetical protein